MKSYVLRHFNLRLDPRSLSLFRIVIALNVIYNLLFYRFPFIGIYYGEQSMPTKETHDLFLDLFSVLHYMPNWLVFIYFTVTLIVSVLFLLGFRSRLTAFILFILFAQIISANGLVVHAVEFILEVCLFWGMFLNLEDHFVPNWISKYNKPRKHLAGFEFGLLLQIALMYFTSVVTKTGPFWKAGLVINTISNDLTFHSLFSQFFVNSPLLSYYMTYGALVVEMSIALLIFIKSKNQWTRILASILIVALHVGIRLALNVGPFYLSTLCYAVVLLPESFWSKVKRYAVLNKVSKLPIQYPKIQKVLLLLFCLFILFQNMHKWQRNSYLSPVFNATIIGNLFKEKISRPKHFCGIWDQPWYFYAPKITSDLGTFVLAGQTKRNQFINIIDGSPFEYYKKDGNTEFKVKPLNRLKYSDYVFSWYIKADRNMFSPTDYKNWKSSILDRYYKSRIPLNETKLFYYSDKASLISGKVNRNKRLILLSD